MGAFELEGREAGPAEEDPFEERLAARRGSHAARGHSPGELAFERSMLLPAEAPVGWEQLKQRKQKAIAKLSQRENSKRAHHACKAGGWATALKPGALGKLAVPRVGPCKVAKHHSNGTLSYEKEPFTPERASARRCKPHEWKHPPE